MPNRPLQRVARIAGAGDEGEAGSDYAPSLLGFVPEYDKIAGWLKPPDAERLFQEAAAVKSGCIVEIGSYRGRSTVALAAGARNGLKQPIFAIEPHEPFIGPRGGAFGPNDRRAFLQNLLGAKLVGMVRLLNATSEVVTPGWDKPVALLFIDGDHRYAAALGDFSHWRPHLINGATVIFNNAKGPGPAQLIQELLAEECLADATWTGNLCIARFAALPTAPPKPPPRKMPVLTAPPPIERPPALAESSVRKSVYPALVIKPASEAARPNLAGIGKGVYFGGNGSYLYQPIPKCGCTSIKTTLLELENLPVSPDEWTRHNKQFNNFPGTDHLTPAAQQAVFEGRTKTFKFVVVRDPFSRMASTYADKILGGYESSSRFWINQIKRAAMQQEIPLSEKITFEEFVQVAIGQPIKDMDPHWRLQYHTGHLDVIKFDFVGHLEMLSTDLLYLLERLRAPRELIEKSSKPHNVTGASLAMWAQISAATRDAFIKKYEIDFDTLHYPIRRYAGW